MKLINGESNFLRSQKIIDFCMRQSKENSHNPPKLIIGNGNLQKKKSKICRLKLDFFFSAYQFLSVTPWAIFIRSPSLWYISFPSQVPSYSHPFTPSLSSHPSSSPAQVRRWHTSAPQLSHRRYNPISFTNMKGYFFFLFNIYSPSLIALFPSHLPKYSQYLILVLTLLLRLPDTGSRMAHFGSATLTSPKWSRTSSTTWPWALAPTTCRRCSVTFASCVWEAHLSAWRASLTTSWTRSGTSCRPGPRC